MEKRGYEYFGARLLREHPAAHSALKAGMFRSLRAACISVGLMSPRSRLSELKNAYVKATSTERAEFLDYLRRIGACTTPSPPSPTASIPSPRSASAAPSSPSTKTARAKIRSPFSIAVDGCLTPQAKARVLAIMDRRGLIGKQGQHRTAQVMREFGPTFSTRDPSLGMALQRDTRLTDEMLQALEKWILANS